MKLHQTSSAGKNLITSVEKGHIRINQDNYSGNLIVTPDRIETWTATTFETLEPHHFEVLLAYAPEVILIGSGPRLIFPHPRLTAALAGARIGFEIMDTAAACRAFNILMAEDRHVVAALMI